MAQLDFFITPELENKGQSIAKKVVVAAVTVKNPQPKPKPAPYGKCACGHPIQFPGLDASFCESCNWKTDTQWLTSVHD